MDIDAGIASLEAGAHVQGVFLLKDKRLATSKAGKSYLTLVLGDRSGEIEGKLWDEADIVNERIERMSPVHVEGVVSVYREKSQVTVRTLKTVPWSDELFEKLVPVSRFSVEEMTGEMDRLLSAVRNPHLRELARVMRSDEALMSRFTAVPAAKFIHHAYLRGLLEHTVSMMTVAASMSEHYGKMMPGLVDGDLLLLGAFLHDMGKTQEYEFERGLDLTKRGRLIGHLVLGISILERALAKIPGFPDELGDRLKHLIVSHHGDFDKGAPLRPVTIEAQLLHHIDYLDSQVNAVGLLLEEAGEDEWTDYSRKFGRRFLTPVVPPAREEKSEEYGPWEEESEQERSEQGQREEPVTPHAIDRGEGKKEEPEPADSTEEKKKPRGLPGLF